MNRKEINHPAYPPKGWINPISEEIRLNQSLMYKAKRIIVFAGAGMSADIGVKPYWTGDDKKYGDEVSKEGYTSYEHAQASLWDEDQSAQIRHFNNTLHQAVNNNVSELDSPYRTLKKFLTNMEKEYFICTSNVDGAFERTGFNKDKIYEVHGSRLRSQCLEFPHHGICDTDVMSGNPTRCPKCNGYTRPNTLFFGDFEFNSKIATKQRTNFYNFRQSDEKDTLILLIGAGLTVPTIHNEAITTSLAYQLPLVRINPDPLPDEYVPKHHTLVDQLDRSKPFLGFLSLPKTKPLFVDIKETANSGLSKTINIIKY